MPQPIPEICITPADSCGSDDEFTGNKSSIPDSRQNSRQNKASGSSVFAEDMTSDEGSDMADHPRPRSSEISSSENLKENYNSEEGITTVTQGNTIEDYSREGENIVTSDGESNTSAEEFEMPDEALLDTDLLPSLDCKLYIFHFFFGLGN